ncbi:MAG: hypothetical protein Q8K65_00650, partial [Alphaproteobacteria bacterium]|nr:hypothetical protein [Alphaproteobacteria bacterium]
MFAGAGDFFRPVDLRKEVTPSAAVRPAARSGDEPQKRSGDEPQKHGGDEPQKRSGDEPQKHDGEPKKHSPEELQKHTIDALPDGEGAADPFSGDAVELSIAALFVMLAGRAP